MKRLAIIMAAVFAGAIWAAGDEQAPTSGGPSAVSAPAGTSAPGVINLGSVRVDLKKRQVSLDAEVCLREGALEFFVCKVNSKEHESILATKAEGWQIHAGLLALGLLPGKPARWVNTPDDDQGRFLPPQGAELDITLHWKDSDGKSREAPACDWMAVPGGIKAAPPKTWVFVGSDVLPDHKYAADAEGEFISVSNFADAIIDVPFESSNKDALREFVAKTEAIPEIGTPVEVVITPLPNAAKADHARVLMEIDRVGRLWHDGQRILDEDLPKWAAAYLLVHAKGQVVLRVDARALAYDIYRTRDQLRMGGLTDVEEEYLLPAPENPIPPRSADEADRSLAWWGKQFARASDLIFDPAIDARSMLGEVKRQIEQMKALETTLQQYDTALAAMLRSYQASTQPGSTRPFRPPSPAKSPVGPADDKP